jgi:hypothetical protein
MYSYDNKVIFNFYEFSFIRFINKFFTKFYFGYDLPSAT